MGHPPVTPALPEDDLAIVERASREPVALCLRELGSGLSGLTEREARRRLQVFGPNRLPPAPRQSWLAGLVVQLTHPLALLLWAAAALAAVAVAPVLATAIVAVVLLNAGFALLQEQQAHRAVEALSEYLPAVVRVVRDAVVVQVDVADLVPGDVIVIGEGDRIPADGRLIEGALEIDLSTLTGESAPVERVAGLTAADTSRFALPDLVFSGSLCTGGDARAVVLSTGPRSEIGRIAALTHRVLRDRSPLEDQVRRVAWLIAGVAVAVGLAFLPLGLVAGLSLSAALLFAIGLLVANVPEGLLPTITLALAAGVRTLARQGAVVKRLSAIETLGSTTVICTDKTGTLTLNRMQPAAVWVPGHEPRALDGGPVAASPAERALADAAAGCSVVEVVDGRPSAADPTELGLYEACAALGSALRGSSTTGREVFRFDPDRRLATAVLERDGALVAFVKGAPESVLARCVEVAVDDEVTPLDAAGRADAQAWLDGMTTDGLRVIALARRSLRRRPAHRDEAEDGLTFLGMIGLHDPPRPEVAPAVADCHAAGIRIHIVTGDNGNTAAHIARAVGIGEAGLRVVDGSDFDRMPETELDHLLRGDDEIVFARSSPEAKLRVTDALRALGYVVAMTGDGVNDAPALHRADIGVAMGSSGTEVAREAATMVLTDDNFATIVRAVRAGRQVYDNVRKFIVYIFAHAVPEVVPFLVFALSGGAVPLPLTVMQILAIDLGTETLPALALGREPAEPGVMARPPRRRDEGVVNRELLVRAWAFMGLISAALVMGAFFFVLWRAGWHPGDAVGRGSALHHAYLQATTTTWAAIVACQVGTALASRTEHASLRAVGLTSNRLLLWGIAFELVFSAAVIVTPGLRDVFGMAPPPASALLLIAPFPVVVWGADELRRARRRRQAQ